MMNLSDWAKELLPQHLINRLQTSIPTGPNFFQECTVREKEAAPMTLDERQSIPYEPMEVETFHEANELTVSSVLVPEKNKGLNAETSVVPVVINVEDLPPLIRSRIVVGRRKEATSDHDSDSTSSESCLSKTLRKRRNMMKLSKEKLWTFIERNWQLFRNEPIRPAPAIKIRAQQASLAEQSDPDISSAKERLANQENRAYLQLVWHSFPEFRENHDLLLSRRPTTVIYERDSLLIPIHRYLFRGKLRVTGVRFFLDDELEYTKRLAHVVAYFNPS
mmetsp:Transcript_22288/g.40366  ORF Transcript_22288/g.40366 Transcript_22288/m.40366 type:complete len:277 (+) Transcript_22288:904-1734(+)